MTGFHEIRFPLTVSSASKGGPQRKTDIVTLRSGAEQRNSIWADSLRKYQAGPGVKTVEQLQQVVVFFEERRGRLYGFRWKDLTDSQSSLPGQPIAATDQTIAVGDGSTKVFQLVKIYGGAFAPWSRLIRKPVAGTVVMAIGGVVTAATVDTTTGLVTFASAPASGVIVSAGYEFDVPVRFDTDYIEMTMMPKFNGALDIAIVEIRV
jgi:uncharacterized protein (TIGR02217 family)